MRRIAQELAERRIEQDALSAQIDHANEGLLLLRQDPDSLVHVCQENLTAARGALVEIQAEQQHIRTRLNELLVLARTSTSHSPASSPR